MRRPFLLALVPLVLAGPAPAQHAGHSGPHAHAARPYAGLETRTVKALSDAEVADLRAGRGMGLALAAELNGYPGPLHVLEHADALSLDGSRRAQVRALHDAMEAAAKPLGERIVAAEEALDGLFRHRTVGPESLARATAEIARLTGELRALHLGYHLLTAALLTPDEIRRYGEARGYGARP